MPTKRCSLTRVALVELVVTELNLPVMTWGSGYLFSTGENKQCTISETAKMTSNIDNKRNWKWNAAAKCFGTWSVLESTFSKLPLPPLPLLTSQQGAFLVSACLHGASRWNVIKFHQQLILRKHSCTQSIWIKAKQRTRLLEAIPAPSPPHPPLRFLWWIIGGIF